jgi:hypothetical protein
MGLLRLWIIVFVTNYSMDLVDETYMELNDYMRIVFVSI